MGGESEQFYFNLSLLRLPKIKSTACYGIAQAEESDYDLFQENCDR
jgi:hypothetical protein